MNSRVWKSIGLISVILGAGLCVTICLFPQYFKFKKDLNLPQLEYVVIHPFMPGTEIDMTWVPEMIEKLGTGSNSCRLAFVGVLFTLDWSDAYLEQQLDLFFQTAENYQLPLLIHLDSEHFYENRPDLWNWWNTSLPGYNESNRDNVEWIDWNTPMERGYLNWGSPIQLAPRLCFESPIVQAEVQRKSTVIGNKINQWRTNLTANNQSDLFLGIDPGWETGIDTYVDVDWVPESDRYKLGYRALKYRGFNESNPPENFNLELSKVVQAFAAFEAKCFYDLGIPKTKIFTHIWGVEEIEQPYKQHAPLNASINDYSTPGLSLYPPSYNISHVKELMGNRDWTIMECPPLEDYQSILEIGRCKMVVIYNWGLTIKNDPDAIKSIINLLENKGRNA